MSKTSFVRAHWLLMVVVGLSLLVLLIGLWLIQVSDPPTTPDTTPETSTEFELPPIPELPELVQTGPADLERVQEALASLAAGIVPDAQGLSAEALDQALSQEEVASENWCDLMLLKADSAWTDEDSRIFAENCI